MRHSASLLLSAAFLLLLAGHASVLATAESTNTAPDSSCAEIRGVDFTHVEDAPAQILRAEVVDATADSLAYCRVQGYVLPQVGFEIRLPLSNWNSKLLEVGDGGWGGEMYLFFCTGPLRRGYACIASDMGHTGASGVGLWARDNLQAQVDLLPRDSCHRADRRGDRGRVLP